MSTRFPHRLLPSLLLAAALAAQAEVPAPKALPADRAPGATLVTVEHTKQWLSTLASAEFGGRGTGQEGFRLAAEFVRDHFQALGLEPLGDGGTFFQKVPWGAARVDVERTSLTFRKGGKAVVVPGSRLAGTVGQGKKSSGPCVLVRTLDAAAIEGMDLAGKVVVLLTDEEAGALEGMRALQGKNAAEILLAQQAAVTGRLEGRSGRRGGNRAARGMSRIPGAVTFGGDDLTKLLELGGVDAGARDAMTALGCEASLELAMQEVDDLPAWNVVARLPGRDPARAKEHVVIGSHLDHLGRRGERFFPGADDDGSGTTGVLAVSTMLAKNPTRPARSVVFVCFCGEESGLVGSGFFVQNCPVPLSSIVAELQMDMIGRDEEANMESRTEAERSEKAADNRNTVHLIGTRKLAPELHELCLQKNETAGFELEWDQEGMFSRSDHAHFARMGVPIAFFFTGLHADYHQVSDTPDKINYDKLLRIATWVYDIAFELAQQEGRPQIDPELWQGYRGRGSGEPAAPLRGKDGR
jgi:hypothetical protein